VVCAPVSIGARGQAGRTRSAGGRVGTDGVDEDAMVADGAGVGAGEVKGEEGGEPTEEQGWVIVVDGAEGEGVVGAAVGAGRARAGATHSGSLWRRPRRPPVRRAAARGRHGSWTMEAAGRTIAGAGGCRQGATGGTGRRGRCDDGRGGGWSRRGRPERGAGQWWGSGVTVALASQRTAAMAARSVRVRVRMSWARRLTSITT